MTFHTFQGEACILMIRVGGGIEIRQVTIDAIIPNPIEFQVGFRNVALRAGSSCVITQERKSILFVEFRDIINQPIFRGVAACAISTKGGPVKVGMARDAIRLCFGKDQCFMASPAIYSTMLSR